MLSLNVKADTKGIVASISRYAEDQKKAIVRALNKTADQARTAASQEVRAAGYEIKASAIKKSFSIQRANAGRLVVTLKSTGQPIALVNYSARQNKGGVSVNVKTGRQTLSHAFIATMRNGHKGVFVRTGGKGAKRLPIKELYGPSIPTALGNDVVEKAIMKKIREKYPQILRHEIAFLASKRK